jgi:hypothetical protein
VGGAVSGRAAITTTNPFYEAQIKIKEMLRLLPSQCHIIAESTSKRCQNALPGGICDIARLAINLDDEQLRAALDFTVYFVRHPGIPENVELLSAAAERSRRVRNAFLSWFRISAAAR